MGTAVDQVTALYESLAAHYGTMGTSDVGDVPVLDVSDSTPYTQDEALRRAKQDEDGTPSPSTAAASDVVHEGTSVIREAALTSKTKSDILTDDFADASANSAYYTTQASIVKSRLLGETQMAAI